jgi:hypothetical protein
MYYVYMCVGVCIYVYIYIYIGKGHPITGHQGPRGVVEV